MYLMRECVMSFVRSLALLLSIIGKKKCLGWKKSCTKFLAKRACNFKKNEDTGDIDCK